MRAAIRRCGKSQAKGNPIAPMRIGPITDAAGLIVSLIGPLAVKADQPKSN
jgi:hypothetical protein